MSAVWPMARVVWAILGVLVLAGAALGVYFSLPSDDTTQSNAHNGFALSVDAAPRPLPELAFHDGEGRERSLAEFRDRVVLLNIWATWCVPCRQEMPALDRLQRKLGGPGFEVLALSIDAGGAAVVKQFYEEIGIRSLAIYVDQKSSVMGKLGLIGIPTTLLVDHEGRELGRLSGPAQWDGAEAVRMIEGHLKRVGQ